jgi:hypothetical protein
MHTPRANRKPMLGNWQGNSTMFLIDVHLLTIQYNKNLRSYTFPDRSVGQHILKIKHKIKLLLFDLQI